MLNNILVTGGSGFIGSHFIRQTLIHYPNVHVINLDKLSYASAVVDLVSDIADRYTLVRGCISNGKIVNQLLYKYEPKWVINFAAETHVDNSIFQPSLFLRNNTIFSCSFLHSILHWWQQLSTENQQQFRFLNISTDEVYGSLSDRHGQFTEESPCAPRSPYSASKAAVDHFANAYHHTYGLPVITTRCANNYGPRQYPEKLIPLMVMRAINRQSLPVYGTGKNVREWIHVIDHVTALIRVLEFGNVGEIYNIGSDYEQTNIQVVQSICDILDNMFNETGSERRSDKIKFVADRLGHDFRYSVDNKRVRQLGWIPRYGMHTGLIETIKWYVDNHDAITTIWPNLADRAVV